MSRCSSDALEPPPRHRHRLDGGRRRHRRRPTPPRHPLRPPLRSRTPRTSWRTSRRSRATSPTAPRPQRAARCRSHGGRRRAHSPLSASAPTAPAATTTLERAQRSAAFGTGRRRRPGRPASPARSPTLDRAAVARSGRSPRTTAPSRWPTRPGSPPTSPASGQRRHRRRPARHAPATARGDFDFYRDRGRRGRPGCSPSTSTPSPSAPSSTPSSPCSTPTGQILAFNDDSPELDSFVQLELPADGDYLVAVAAFGSLPTNPFDSGSGTGARSEGAYDVTMSFEFAEDVDVYRIDMQPGDVLGAGVCKAAAACSSCSTRPARSSWVPDATWHGIYPAHSPLNVAGNATLDHVAAVDGPHYLRVSRGSGPVRARPAHPPAGHRDRTRPGSRQILFLDFDGAFVDPSDVRHATAARPLAARRLPGRLGPGPADESALIDAIVATLHREPRRRPARHAAATSASTSRSATAATTPTRGASRTSPGSSSAAPASSSASTPSGSRRVGRPGQLRTGGDRRRAARPGQRRRPARGCGRSTTSSRPDTDVIGLVGSVARLRRLARGRPPARQLAHRSRTTASSASWTRSTSPSSGSGPDFVFGTADDVDVDFVVDQLDRGPHRRRGHDDPRRLRPVVARPAPPLTGRWTRRR